MYTCNRLAKYQAFWGPAVLARLANDMRQLGKDDFPHGQLDRRARARHDEDDPITDQSSDGPAQEASRADLGIAQHAKQLAIAG